MNLLIRIFYFFDVLIFFILAERIINHILIKNLSKDYMYNGKKIHHYLIYPIRFIIGILIIYSFFLLIPLPGEFLFMLSVVIGTAITLASFHTIQNFSSGLLILLSKPFKTNDIIIVDGMLGKVEKISLNYIKLKTLEDSFVVIPNKNISKHIITTFTNDYSIDENKNNSDFNGIKKIIFDLSLPIMDPKMIQSRFNDVAKEFTPIFGFPPECLLYTLSNKLDYKCVVKSTNSDLLLTSLINFRNKLLEQFY